MATIAENEFTFYHFDERELPQACGFSELNLQWIRTCRATLAIQKSNVRFTDTEDKKAMLALTFLDGGMAAIDILLQKHEEYAQTREDDLRADMVGQGNVPYAPGLDLSSLFKTDANDINATNPNGVK